MISICLVITFITEFFFLERDIFLSYIDFSKALFLILIKHIFGPIADLIEKYLFEYDYMDPFLVLMYEAIVGFCVSFLLYFTPNYLEDLINVLKRKYLAL